jgi:putative FmdB family regulatory protein
VPLYEYRCQECGHQFEKIQSFSAPEEKECPICKGELEKLISAPAFHFKGAGWYVNDYASKGSKAEAKAAESSGDSKPATSSSDSKSGSSSGASSESSSSTPAPAASTAKSE